MPELTIDERKRCLKILDSGKTLAPEIIEHLRGVYQRSLWLLATELCEVPLRPLHKVICDFFITKEPTKPLEEQDRTNERLLLFPRLGWKALDVETLIPTPSGYKKMGDIKIGDEVFSNDGIPYKVNGVSPVYYDRPCYEVVFSTGDFIVCDEDHLWETQARNDMRLPKGIKHGTKRPYATVKTTKRIWETVNYGKSKVGNNHNVEVCAPVINNDVPLSIHPYVLGCWLGDGTASNSQITIGHEDKVELVKNIAAFEEISWVRNDARDGRTGTFHLGSRTRTNADPNKFMVRLRNLGVLGKKHIPKNYLKASLEQRLALLQGLMDTDGTCDERGKASFSNTNVELVAGFRELLCSLGFKPGKIGVYEKGENCSDELVVNFKVFFDRPIFKLPRKYERQQKVVGKFSKKFRQIVAVNRVASRPVKCISVESPSHLYLVGKAYIPTHNTTIDALDVVNWLICFPYITVGIQCGDGDLANSIVGLIKSYFIVPGWEGKRDDNTNPIWNDRARPSQFHRLFPEHCIPDVGRDRGAEDNFISPTRKLKHKWLQIKEPSVYALSIESNTSGWRCQVLKNDDILTDQNIRTPARLVAIDRRFHMSKKLIPLGWGYRDTIGTRYENDDTYGRLLRKMGLGDEAVYGDITIAEKRFRYLCYPAWWLKGTGPDGEGELKNKYLAPSVTSKEEECDFLDPVLWPYDALKQDMDLDAKVHAGQYLNNPSLAGENDFTRAGMLKCFVEWTQKPLNGKVYAIVDLAYSDKRGRDYTVIAVGMWYNDSLWIIDIVRGRFRPEEMAEQIVGVVRDYPEIEAMGIEESVGAKWLKNDIFAAAERQGIILPNIEWISLGQGELNAKENRIKGLVPLYKNGRFFILNNVRTDQEEIIREFINSRAKKDVPDAISRFFKYQMSSTSVEDKQAKIDQRRAMREQDNFDMIYGQGRYAYVEPPQPVEEVEEYVEPEIDRDPVTGLPTGMAYQSAIY